MVRPLPCYASAPSFCLGWVRSLRSYSSTVLDGGGIAAVDQPMVAWLAAHREPLVTNVMRTVSRLTVTVVKLVVHH